MSNSIKFKLAVGILLSLVFLQPFLSASKFSPASDEITHLPSGYSYWKTGLIELNPQHPPFVKLLAAFPLLFMDLNFDPKDPYLSGTLKDEWKFGANFLFSNDVGKILLWGRMPIMLISLLLGLYIYKWSSEMFNKKAGLLSLFLYSFMPNMIAHAQFVTTDLALAAFSFISLYYLWKYFRFKGILNLILAGIFLGLALASKFSAVFLLLIVLILTIVHFVRKKENFDRTINNTLKLIMFLLGLSIAILYISYLFPPDASFYLKGLKTVYADWSKNYAFYLNGNFKPGGWWYYFIFAFLIKTPIPALIAFVVAILFYKKIKLSNDDKLFIFVPLFVFLIITSWKAGNVGIRYLLPVYPFIMLYAGGLAEFLKISRKSLKSTVISIMLVGMAVWYILSSLLIHPDYLAYFNELVGGPKNGYKYLDDSNIEWGQDLKRMKEYQEKHPEVNVVYSWGHSKTAYYKIQNIVPVDDSGWWKEPKGLYAINTFLLVRMQYLSQGRNDPSLNWLALYKPVDRIGYSFFVYKF